MDRSSCWGVWGQLKWPFLPILVVSNKTPGRRNGHERFGDDTTTTTPAPLAARGLAAGVDTLCLETGLASPTPGTTASLVALAGRAAAVDLGLVYLVLRRFVGRTL